MGRRGEANSTPDQSPLSLGLLSSWWSLGPGPSWDRQPPGLSQGCPGWRDCSREEGGKEELHCVLSTVCQEKGVGGGQCVALPSCPLGPPMGPEAQTDTREATLWFSEARSERYACGPQWGWQVLHPAALTPGRGPLRPLQGCPRPATPTPAPPSRVFFLSPTWVPEDQLGNLLFFLVR